MTILCADDFGQTDGISEGIISLCTAGKLNATSAMTEAPLLRKHAPQLMSLGNVVQVGLHFNLTFPYAKKPFARNFLMLCPRLSQADREDVEARLKEQLKTFEEVFGRPPDFVDGHEHIQVMPGVRPVFLRVLEEYFAGRKKPWIRQIANPVMDTDTRFKAFVLNMLNIGFKAACEKRGFRTNSTFRGVYSLTPEAPFEQMMKGWLRGTTEHTLIMCHPSARVEDGDVISPARAREFGVLSAIA